VATNKYGLMVTAAGYKQYKILPHFLRVSRASLYHLNIAGATVTVEI
jgi:hypothetical protein